MKIENFQVTDKFPAVLRTVNLQVDAINSCSWFKHVGKSNIINADRVLDWGSALMLAGDDAIDAAFSNYIQTLVNETRSFAASMDRDLYNRSWGKAYNAVGKVLMPYLKKKVFPLIPQKPLTNFIASGVSGCLLNQLSLAILYDSNFAPLERHVGYFLSGHYPCGYKGIYPSGLPIVF